jgi:hypothetical protein
MHAHILFKDLCVKTIFAGKKVFLERTPWSLDFGLYKVGHMSPMAQFSSDTLALKHGSLFPLGHRCGEIRNKSYDRELQRQRCEFYNTKCQNGLAYCNSGFVA